MIDFTINKEGLRHNIEKARENHIVIPTIRQMQHPELIPGITSLSRPSGRCSIPS